MVMRFRAHETFFIRKGWLSKGMRQVLRNADVFIDKNEYPTDVLGIGTNMVKSLRFWLQAVGLTVEPRSGKRPQSLTDLGKIIYKNDPYIEEIGTLQLLHYKLVNNHDSATSWYYFFNEFNMIEFTREDFVQALQNYAIMNGESVAVRSSEDDFNCIVSTYLPRYKVNPDKVDPENNIECPFAEMGLIDILNKNNKSYKKTSMNPNTFNPWVVLAIIMDKADGAKEITLNELLTGKGNIGKAFNLDAISMLDILHNVEKTGEIKIIRTAGLDVVSLHNNYTFLECVSKYYDSIEEV